jgi:hypothetical protein
LYGCVWLSSICLALLHKIVLHPPAREASQPTGQHGDLIYFGRLEYLAIEKQQGACRQAPSTFVVVQERTILHDSKIQYSGEIENDGLSPEANRFFGISMELSSKAASRTPGKPPKRTTTSSAMAMIICVVSYFSSISVWQAHAGHYDAGACSCVDSMTASKPGS